MGDIPLQYVDIADMGTGPYIIEKRPLEFGGAQQGQVCHGKCACWDCWGNGPENMCTQEGETPQ